MTTDAELNEYELQRLERIRQNKERMAELQLDTLAAQLIPVKRSAPATQRGISKKKRLSNESVPRRRSERIKGNPSDGAHVVSEGRGGDVVVSGIPDSGNGNATPEPYVRHIKTDTPFKSVESQPSNDAAFIRMLAGAKGLKHHKPAAKAALSAASLSKWQLKEDDVAKVTKQSITHMGFMPTANVCVIAAADKRGGLGLWNIDYGLFPDEEGSPGPAVKEATVALESEASGGAASSPTNNTNDEEDDFDGVLSFSIHNQYISGLKWAGDGAAAKLYTGSYDGSLRMLDPSKEAFILAWGDEDMEYSCMDVTPDGNTAFLGDNEGSLDVVDLRTAKRSHATTAIHNRKVNTVHLEPTEQRLLVTGATDSAIHVWDVRKMGPKCKPVASGAHNQTCQAAYFAPDGSARLVTTSFDDTVRIWDTKKGLKEVHRIKHDNQTGRWVMPFRAIWSQQGDAVIVGNMKRFVDVFNASTGTLQAQLHSEWMTAIAARNCVHPLLNILAAGTASGRLHLYR